MKSVIDSSVFTIYYKQIEFSLPSAFFVFFFFVAKSKFVASVFVCEQKTHSKTFCFEIGFVIFYAAEITIACNVIFTMKSE